MSDAGVATFLIKRKWPKIDRGGPRAPSEAKGSGGGLRLGPPLVLWPVPSLRTPPGKAVGSSAKRQASRGARQPGPPLVSQRFQAAFWAPFPTPYPGGKRQPRTGHDQWRAGLTPPSLELRPRERQSYQGASGGPDSAANRAAGRADTPRWMAVALHGGPGGSPAALCHFLSAEKVKPGVALRPE